MSETTNSSITLDALTIGDSISQHHGVKCCPAIREGTDERYIVKFLSIPASQVQLDALLLTGAYPTPAHAMEYFRSRAEEVLKEVDVLNRLHAMEGFLPFTNAELRKSEDNVGYQVCLISPYKRSLARQMQLKPLTHLGAVNLGLDMCAALTICRRAGYLYIDLKPTNVYVTPNQGYRISDLGFVALNSLKYASYPEQYRSPYTAPEIDDAMSALNDRIDIYALGLILYQVYNNGELPAKAGSAFPPPAYADYEMAEIILKACDPDPAKRWADPLQMGQAIVAYMQRNNVNDTPIVPPPVEIPEEPAEEEAEQPDTVEEVDISDNPVAMLDSILKAAAEEEAATEDESATEEEPEQEDVVEQPGIEATEVAEEEAAAEEDSVSAEESPVDEEAPVAEEAEDDDKVPAIEVAEGETDPVMDLSFIIDLTEDETAPSEESAAEIKIDLVSDEVQDMLARADELISHELPEPAVAPEPIEVPFPAPITLPDEEDSEETDILADSVVVADATTETEDPSDNDVAEASEATDEASETTEEASDIVDADEADTTEDEAPWLEESDVSEYYSDANRRGNRSRVVKNILIITATIALLAALITGGFLFYQHYFLQPVNSFEITGSVDTLTIQIDSHIKDELLTVVCTDTYGNTRTQEVIDGRAHFTNLTPNTQYRVELSISGFHRLTGVTSGNYTTAAQTEIINLTAVAGPEDGSVILSFAVNGPDSDYWTVAYSTGNDPEIIKPFPGHTVTITGLTVGSEYLFRLIPGEDQYLTGAWLLHYTAQQIVYAQELSIQSCVDGALIAAWNVPNGLEGQTWNVRCYNDNGYDKTITTTDTMAEFTGLDHAYGYTVDVTAVGMTQSATASVSANPITITSISATEEKNDTLTLNWAYTGQAPTEGWILDYTIDGGTVNTVACQDTTAQVQMYPGSKYEFDVRPVGDVTCFRQPLTHELEQPAMFSGYSVSAEQMEIYMCLTPDEEDWDKFDVPQSSYVDTFKVGDKASFLVELQKSYDKSDDKITITYVVRDEAGSPVSLKTESKTWRKMWSNRCCALDIPNMPKTAGVYTIDIYFNDQQINKEDIKFTIN